MFTTQCELEIKSANEKKIPSCIDIGLEASRKGNFAVARQMFRTAIEQLESQKDNTAVIEVLKYTADTYLNEAQYDLAEQWYKKALQRCEKNLGKDTLQAACLIARSAEISVLKADMSEFQKSFANVERIYLFSQDTDMSDLLHTLIDLSWALCVQGHTTEIQPVNSLIAQIKQIEEEKLLRSVA